MCLCVCVFSDLISISLDGSLDLKHFTWEVGGAQGGDGIPKSRMEV